MFAHSTRQRATAFVFALFATVAMLGAVDSLATHPAADAQWAQGSSALQCSRAA